MLRIVTNGCDLCDFQEKKWTHEFHKGRKLSCLLFANFGTLYKCINQAFLKQSGANQCFRDIYLKI